METRGEDYRELEKKVGEFREVIYRKEDEIEELKRKMAFLKKEDRSMEKSRENVADFNEKLRASEQNREKLSEEIENLLQEKATLKDELQKQAKIIETLSETQSRPRITPPTPTNSDLVSILNKEKRELSDLLFQKTLAIEDLLEQKRQLLQNTKKLEFTINRLNEHVDTLTRRLHASSTSTLATPVLVPPLTLATTSSLDSMPDSAPTPRSSPSLNFGEDTLYSTTLIQNEPLDNTPLTLSKTNTPAPFPMTMAEGMTLPTTVSVQEPLPQQVVGQGGGQRRSWLINPVGFLWRSVVGSQ